MVKPTKFRLILLLATIATISSALPIQAFIRQNLSPQPPHLTTTVALRLGEIIGLLGRKKGTRGSRAPELWDINLCMLTPGKLPDDPQKVRDESSRLRGNVEIWDYQPLFVWQGEMGGIEVREIRTNKLIWEKSLEPGTNTIVYDGEPLEAGKNYFWRDNTRPLEQLPGKVSFRPMGEERRSEVTQELADLEREAKAQGKTESEITHGRITYFIENQFWSDALKEIHLISNPSGEVTELTEEIKEGFFCSEFDL